MARICYLGQVKNRSLVHTIALIVCLGAFSLVHASSPKPKNDPTSKTRSDSLPISQEAEEESVLPEEPMLSAPTPEPNPGYVGLPVQPLPSGGIMQPSGPTVDEKRKLAEAFRAAKTEAEEQFTLADIKIRAFAAPTEREKRALLREYYQALSAYIVKKSPTLKDSAQVWSSVQQNRLARTRTEPDYQSAVLLKAKVDAADDTPPATSEEESNLLPALNN